MDFKVGDLVTINDERRKTYVVFNCANGKHDCDGFVGEIIKIVETRSAFGDQIVTVWWPHLNKDLDFTSRFLDKI